MKHHIVGVMLLLGTVDYIDNGVADVEITTSHHEIIYAALPVSLFPCKLKEGDMFYFEYLDGVTEIRCGEPGE